MTNEAHISSDVAPEGINLPYAITSIIFSYGPIPRPDKFDWERARAPAVPLPFEKSLVLWVGRVTLAWNVLEQALTETIQKLLNESRRPVPERWQRWPFSRKRQLCRELVEEVIAEPNGLRPHMLRLLENAAELAWRRNALVHGQLMGPIPAFGDSRVGIDIWPALYMDDDRGDGVKKWAYTEDVLASIFYGISELSGWLLYLNTLTPGPPVYIPDDLAQKIAQARGPTGAAMSPTWGSGPEDSNG